MQQQATATIGSSRGQPVEGLLVQCDLCRNRAHVYQLDMAEGTVIQQYCSHCGVETSWRENRRKENRPSLKMALCVRTPDVGEEVASTEDVSRGGLCFQSSRLYLEGSSIEVAVPYTRGAMNIFVPCRILSMDLRPGSRMVRYHVSYDRE